MNDLIPFLTWTSVSSILDNSARLHNFSQAWLCPSVEIIISNSYLGEVDINNIYEKGYSTKGKSRGYGLSLVKNILENSDIFSSETTRCNGIYTQKLNIKGK